MSYVPKTRGSFLNVKTNIMYTVNVIITNIFSIFTNNEINLMFYTRLIYTLNLRYTGFW